MYEKKKLKLVKCNKSLQQKIDISINNYIYFTGNYIIYELNRIGKEYNDNDELEFEGEYLYDKKWNGKCKEYDIWDKLVFDGELVNGERHGKAIEYFGFGPIKFDGEYLKGKKWKGKRYDSNSNFIYELKDGKGIVKEYYDDKLEFEGEYVNGEKNGKAKEYRKYDGYCE